VAARRLRAAGVDGENPREVVAFSICILCDLVLVFSQNNDRELMNALKIRMQHPSAKDVELSVTLSQIRSNHFPKQYFFIKTPDFRSFRNATNHFAHFDHLPLSEDSQKLRFVMSFSFQTPPLSPSQSTQSTLNLYLNYFPSFPSQSLSLVRISIPKALCDEWKYRMN
jgi:hypothetical protein